MNRCEKYPENAVVTTVEMADPIMPYSGINIKFKTTLITQPNKFLIIAYFCKFSMIIN